MKKSSKIVLAGVVTLGQGVSALNLPIQIHAQQPNLDPHRMMQEGVVKPMSGYTFVGAPTAAPQVQDNVATISYANGEKAKVTFLEANLFRFDLEPDG